MEKHIRIDCTTVGLTGEMYIPMSNVAAIRDGVVYLVKPISTANQVITKAKAAQIIATLK